MQNSLFAIITTDNKESASKDFNSVMTSVLIFNENSDFMITRDFEIQIGRASGTPERREERVGTASSKS